MIKPIPNFPNYFADEIGNIYSAKRVGPNSRTPGIPKKMKPSVDRRGYKKLSLKKDGKKFYRMVHQLILETFIGPRPEGMFGCHGQNGISDNSIHNLSWQTPSQNSCDRLRDGTDQNGEKSSVAKLNTLQVRIIKKYYSMKTGRRNHVNYLAKIFNVSTANIEKICRGHTWKYT